MSQHKPYFPPPDGDDQPVVPEDLAQALRSLYSPDMPAPARVDDAVRAAAAERGRAIRRRRIMVRAGAWGSLAAAAGLALAVVIWNAPGQPVAPPSRLAQAPMDVNGDGVVDILDALMLALIVDGRIDEPVQPAWDFTASGSIDREDVDAIAAAVVSLEGGAG